MEPEERRIGEYGTGIGKTRGVWNRKREDQGKCGTERESTGYFAKNEIRYGSGIQEVDN
jgi:hypothetical protein